MQIPPVNVSASTQAQQPASSVAQKAPEENLQHGFKTVYNAFVSDVVNLKNKKPAQQAAIGILTLGSAVAGLCSAKKGLAKAINMIVMAAVGFAAGIGVTNAADKYKKLLSPTPVEQEKPEADKPVKAAEKSEKEEENKSQKSQKSQNSNKSDNNVSESDNSDVQRKKTKKEIDISALALLKHQAENHHS